MTDNAWHLGLVNADGSGFRFVKNAEIRPEAFGAPEWARDGKSIFCHDLDNIYYIDLDGNVLKKWELSKILIDASMNSGDRLSISPDGNSLLMDVDCGSEHERKNWDGPQPAIERLDLSADKAVRITGKDDYVWEPFWLTANEFLCIMQKEGKPSLDSPNVSGRQKSEATRETRANADRERAVAQASCLWGNRASRLVNPVSSPRARCRPDTQLAWPVCYLTQKFPRFRKRLVDLAGIFASALRAFRTSAAFSAYNGRDLLYQFARLKLCRQR
jgi:hypothetical protein